MKKIFLIVSFLFLSTMSLMAQDRIFNYTYQTNVLNKGTKELEVQIGSQDGKENYFRQIKTRVEYEVGLGSNVQTSFYLNSKQKAEFDDVTGEIVMSATEISLSNEWKYKISDPVADPIGFAAYGEFTLATDELEVEVKAIFDKIIGRSTHALNLTLEPEWETSTEDGKLATEFALKYEFDYGYSYNINKSWNLGLEVREVNVYSKADDFTQSALFAGPTVGYNMNNFWINLSFNPQIAGLSNPDSKSGLNVDEFTKYDSRIIFSYTF